MSDAPLKLVHALPERRPRAAPTPSPRSWSRARRIVSIGGGKGGIGKSLISANLGIELARRGKRVVLVDADLGGANLHTTLGIDLPRRTLSDFIERKVPRIEDVVSATGIPNLGLVSGALDHLDAANPKHAQKMRFLRHVQQMDVDYVVLDLESLKKGITLADKQALPGSLLRCDMPMKRFLPQHRTSPPSSARSLRRAGRVRGDLHRRRELRHVYSAQTFNARHERPGRRSTLGGIPPVDSGFPAAPRQSPPPPVQTPQSAGQY